MKFTKEKRIITTQENACQKEGETPSMFKMGATELRNGTFQTGGAGQASTI